MASPLGIPLPPSEWKRQNPPKGPNFDWEMYRYVPSLAGAIVCLVVFLVMAFLHLYQYLRSMNRIIIFVVIGALCEVGGYGARIASHFDNDAWPQYITQGVLTLVGPLWFAATIYMIFVTADVTTLIIQGLGASIMGTMQLALALAGEKIVIAGLALQVATFVVFLIASFDFQIHWKKMLYILYSVSALILFRCTFRLIEYAMGNAAYLIAHEWTLYCFDAVPMVSSPGDAAGFAAKSIC
ncbi:unnamed protein product [Alternaria alternata]